MSSTPVDSSKAKRCVCDHHKDEPSDYLCARCNLLTSKSIMADAHSKCEGDAKIPEAAESEQSELSKPHEDVQKDFGKIKEAEAREKEKKANLTKMKKTAIRSIKDTAARAIEEIKKKESALLETLERIYDKENPLNRRWVGSVSTLEESNVQSVQEIPEVVASNLNCDVITGTRKSCLVESEVCDAAASLLGPRPVFDVYFRMDESKFENSLNSVILGEICTRRVFEETLSTEVDGDAKVPNLVGVTVTNVNNATTVVVADHTNCCVKSFYMKNNKQCYSRLALDFWPWSITKLTQEMVAVCFQGLSEIAVIRVTPDLVFHSTIQTEKKYYSVAAVTPYTLAASDYYGKSVDLLDLTGSVVKSVNSDLSDDRPLSCPDDLRTSPCGDDVVSEPKITSDKQLENTSLEKSVITDSSDHAILSRPNGFGEVPYDGALMSDPGLTSDKEVDNSFLEKSVHVLDQTETVKKSANNDSSDHALLSRPDGLSEVPREGAIVPDPGLTSDKEVDNSFLEKSVHVLDQTETVKKSANNDSSDHALLSRPDGLSEVSCEGAIVPDPGLTSAKEVDSSSLEKSADVFDVTGPVRKSVNTDSDPTLISRPDGPGEEPCEGTIAPDPELISDKEVDNTSLEKSVHFLDQTGTVRISFNNDSDPTLISRPDGLSEEPCEGTIVLDPELTSDKEVDNTSLEKSVDLDQTGTVRISVNNDSDRSLLSQPDGFSEVPCEGTIVSDPGLKSDKELDNSPLEKSAYLFDLTGTVRKSISRDASGHTLFCRPDSLSVTPCGRVVLSDHGNDCITSFDKDGVVVFRCDTNSEPAGVTSDSTGNIFYALKEENRVIQLTSSGQFVHHVLTVRNGLDGPQCLYCDDRRYLYVTQNNGTVKIFRFERTDAASDIV